MLVNHRGVPNASGTFTIRSKLQVLQFGIHRYVSGCSEQGSFPYPAGGKSAPELQKYLKAWGWAVKLPIKSFILLLVWNLLQLNWTPLTVNWRVISNPRAMGWQMPCQSIILLSGTSQIQHLTEVREDTKVLTALFAGMALHIAQPAEWHDEQNTAVQQHLASTMGSDILNGTSLLITCQLDTVRQGQHYIKWRKSEEDRCSTKSSWRPQDESSCLWEHLSKRISEELKVKMFWMRMQPNTNLNLWQIVDNAFKIKLATQWARCFYLGVKQHQIHWEFGRSTILRCTQKEEQHNKVVKTSHYPFFFFFSFWKPNSYMLYKVKTSDIQIALLRT